ncbi:hypothetical protein [Tessaracoccus sp. OH4464_COT-324]|uniref:hypothetical protein n=1 Tax=Tessaracoccus sp. OH4464_COT-324 TaxID=2491059 RepID=UPI000F638A80|nr:hypothetical protein [Tessaracoccus sp. OH4464_COT-324]RRD47331.1 hypothetical protein EII42_03480 [Tessaracoccus sp. OH4464_COT-324]
MSLFERFDTVYVLIAVALIAVGVAHYWLARLHPWLGALVPAIYLGFCGWVFASGNFRGMTDLFLLLLGLFALIAYWLKAREVAASARE